MKKKHISHNSQTDWDRVDKLRDEDIDFSDSPEVTPEMFAKAVLRKGLKPVFVKGVQRSTSKRIWQNSMNSDWEKLGRFRRGKCKKKYRTVFQVFS